ncbi:hypothetical protein TL16_g03159 [Triparma laevis f. inornata]|uniref:Uncharacterized protein n=1 Tax=Triparma laevis f. inornata TaxID=1714386 RepID=A0A9W7DY89_9STRA|nr:hypothetical protein TL16_g03159 [Triparma laevis f. inornata]
MLTPAPPTDLIDENWALQEEYDALEEILQDLKTQNDMAIGSRLRRPKGLDAPERRMLEQKVKILLDAISKAGSSTAVAALGKEDKTYKYFVGNNNNNNNNSNGGGNNNNSNGARSFSASHTSSGSNVFSPSSSRSAPDVLESLSDQINVMEIDDVVEPLRSAFHEEKESLLQDIQMMQAIMEHENERGLKQRPNANRPNVDDLKKFSNKLEETLRQQEVFKDIHKPAFEAATIPPPRLDISPLKNRIKSSTSSSPHINKLNPQPKSSRMRSQLKQQIASGKFEETLDDDDLKFFS